MTICTRDQSGQELDEIHVTIRGRELELQLSDPEHEDACESAYVPDCSDHYHVCINNGVKKIGEIWFDCEEWCGFTHYYRDGDRPITVDTGMDQAETI